MRFGGTAKKVGAALLTLGVGGSLSGCLLGGDLSAYYPESESPPYTTEPWERAGDGRPTLPPRPRDPDTDETSGLNTEQTPEATAPTESARDRNIYRNSRDFAYLETVARITPGAKYQTTKGATCSFGWTVSSGSDDSRIFNLTAGHCGSPGEKVYLQDQSGSSTEVGEFIVQFLDGNTTYIGPGDDYALIEIYPQFREFIDGTPSVKMGYKQVELKGWKRAGWLEATNPYICRIGWRSGLSCGNYQEMRNSKTLTFDSIQDHGDSGGAVWAVDPADPTQQTIYAVAIASFGSEQDASTAGAKVITPMMDHYDLKLRT